MKLRSLATLLFYSILLDTTTENLEAKKTYDYQIKSAMNLIGWHVYDMTSYTLI